MNGRNLSSLLSSSEEDSGSSFSESWRVTGGSGCEEEEEVEISVMQASLSNRNKAF